MTDLARLVVALEAQTAKYQAGLDQANKRLQKFEFDQKTILGKVDKGFSKFTSGVRTTLGLLAGGFAFSKVIQETVAAQNELAQLEAALRSTGEAAGFNRDQLVRMADDMAASTTFSSGEIVQAQTRLLTYTSIVGEKYPKALQIAMDQSARLGISLTQSAEVIGRALETPSRGVASLTRQGFNFTDAQKKMLKSLEDTGRVAEAQQIVLDVLAESYGGAAEAARNTLGGALAGLKNAFNSLMTGDAGIDGMTESINTLADTLNSPQVRAGFATMISGMAKIIELSAKVASGLAIVFTGQGGNRSVDIDLQIEELEKQRKAIERRLNVGGERGPFGDIEFYSDAQLQDDRKRLQSIDEEIKKLLTEQERIFQHGSESGYKPPSVVPAPAAGGTRTSVTTALEEIEAAGEKIGDARTGMQKWLEELDESTKTALEKQIDFLNEFEANLGVLLAEGVIGPEQYAERWQEALDSVLQEVEPAGEKIGDSLMKQFEKVSVFMDQAFRNTTDIIGNYLEDAMSGSFGNIEKDFLKMINALVAQAASARIGEWLFGSGGKGGGALDSAFNFVGGLLRDNGGPGQAGQPYLIGTGAQPEMFIPQTAGTFVPAKDWMGGGSGGGVQQNIYLQGKPDMRTTRQMALEAARLQRTANARLG